MEPRHVAATNRRPPSTGVALLGAVLLATACGQPRAPSSAKEITAFSFLAANNGGVLAADVTANVTGTSIAATVPFGTSVSALKATYSTSGATVAVGATVQASGVTVNDFSSPVIYRVTAADGSTKDYTVTVALAPSTAKELTAFSFLAASNGGVLSADVTASITGTSIAATVPFGTSVSALKATFSTTGTSVTVGGTSQVSVTVGGTSQVSGVTANDFSSPVTYRVTAADGSTQDYTVTVAVAPSPAKEITAFSFLSANNGAVLTGDVTASISGTSITATVPFGTGVSALKATFSTTGASVAVGGTAQVSGVTANDFSAPVTYRVTAADGSTKDFTVTVAFAFGDGSDGALSVSATTTIDTTSTSVNGAAGGTSVVVSSASGLAAGQEVLLHQSQAASGAVGTYEFARVASVSGTTLTLMTALTSTYQTDSTHKAQLVVVPQFSSVSVGAGGVLTAPAWNGSTGGILVLDAQTAVTVSGSVTMDGRGYRGTQHASCGVHCDPGYAGESPLGLGSIGIAANGSGGGGGARGQDCGSGAGGGYGSAGAAGAAVVGGGACAIPGAAAAPGASDGAANLASALLFGSAGGEGGHDEDGGNAGPGGNGGGLGPGGNGGGLIFVRTASVVVSGGGLISSDGGSGGDGNSTICGGGGGMGGGGGGSGGAIRIVATSTASLGTAQVIATGGGGGACSGAGGNPGGAGGAGRIGILAGGVVSGSTTPAYDPE